MKRISRRRFVALSSMGAAGAYLSLHTGLAAAMMQRMGGGGMGGGSVIDPPVGPPLTDPERATNISTTPGEAEFNLDVRIAPVSVNGRTANLMTYNGFYPGPTIRVKKNDTVRINITNSLPYTTETNLIGYQRNITNLHTHGWHVSPEGFADNVMYDLFSGQTRNHVYDTSMLEPGTLNLYHPHKHGVAAEQYWGGLMGALVVEDGNDLLSPFETHIMVLKDITLGGTTEPLTPAPHDSMMDYMHGKEGNIVMVNGQVNPRLYLKKGQVQRWRIVNASSGRFYRLALENHTLQVIGSDGGLLDRPYPVPEILLSPGERVDLLVKGTQSSGNYRLRALPYSRMGMMGGDTITLLTVTCNGSLKRAQAIPAAINPDAVRLAPGSLPMPIAAERTLTLSMGQGNGYINGQDFDAVPYKIMSKLGSYEIWTIVNQSGMDHPFHQHVNAGQILKVTGGNANYTSLYTTAPAWKDVVLVPKWGSVQILLPIMDWPGMTMFHCHILEHEDIGMMGMWHIMDPGPM